MAWMITRTVIKGVVIVMLLLAIASYAAYLKTGRFWIPEWNVQSLSMASFSSIFKQQTVSMEPISKPTERTYKWQKDGRWHYGDAPPPNVKAELISD